MIDATTITVNDIPADILTLQAENGRLKKTKKATMIIVGLLFFTGVVAFFYYYNKNKNKYKYE